MPRPSRFDHAVVCYSYQNSFPDLTSVLSTEERRLAYLVPIFFSHRGHHHRRSANGLKTFSLIIFTTMYFSDCIRLRFTVDCDAMRFCKDCRLRTQEPSRYNNRNQKALLSCDAPCPMHIHKEIRCMNSRRLVKGAARYIEWEQHEGPLPAMI